MARRSTQSRRNRKAQSASPAAPYIKRKLSFFDVLDEEQLVKLEQQVDWMLENIGFAFRDDPTALDVWQSAGVKLVDDKVYADAQWVRELCAQAPGEFTQLARNPARSVTIGGTSQVFAPIYGAPFVRDLEGGRRYGTIADFEKLVKLTYLHPNLHHGGLVVTEPTDVPVSKRHLDMVYAHMTLSDKPGSAPLFSRDERFPMRSLASGIGERGQLEVVRSFHERRGLHENRVTMRDYDWHRSHVVLEGSAEAARSSTASADHHAFPARDEREYQEPCATPAQIRMQRFDAAQQLARGTGTLRTIEPGYRFELVGGYRLAGCEKIVPIRRVEEQSPLQRGNVRAHLGNHRAVVATEELRCRD